MGRIVVPAGNCMVDALENYQHLYCVIEVWSLAWVIPSRYDSSHHQVYWSLKLYHPLLVTRKRTHTHHVRFSPSYVWWPHQWSNRCFMVESEEKNAASESPHHDLGPLGGRFLELSENHHVSWWITEPWLPPFWETPNTHCVKRLKRRLLHLLYQYNPIYIYIPYVHIAILSLKRLNLQTALGKPWCSGTHPRSPPGSHVLIFCHGKWKNILDLNSEIWI